MQVHRLEAVYPPELAEAIIEWLRLRRERDQTLSTEARYYCHAALD